ncbi:MAG TPA: FAD-dependent oxidoreductase [Candidatus Acidoferrales bacterium]|nr:FAD-dependent oxidoreductase [Candidatus Acidoferrales bacterium]
MSNGTANGTAERAVLLGAGHAHLYAARRAEAFTRRGIELVLVAPDTFWYSGLATGMLAGIYPPTLDRVDAGALVTRGGGRFVQDRATRIDASTRTVHLEAGPPLRYDVVSLNVGSEVPVESIPGAATYAYAVKPICNLWHLREELEARLRAAAGTGAVRVVVIGGGATGCEVAANIQRLAHGCGKPIEITVLAKGEGVLEQFPRGTADALARILTRRGITVRLRTAVIRVEPQYAVTVEGESIGFDVLVDAAGLQPAMLIRSSGLQTNDEGALVVDDHLRSIADPNVFGGGDCVAMQGRTLPKIGVYAVRQAPVLVHNLIATLAGKPLERFVPQRRYLLILNLGDGTGLATWGRFRWHGRLAFRLKDYIDRRFLASFQRHGGTVTDTRCAGAHAR